MATATFGQPNPNATDPYPIESVLAKEAITSPAMAQMMLGNYQQKQQAASNVYNQSLEQQHVFARDQLAQQATEARQKLITELIGKPGGNAFMAGGGIEGLGPSAGGNADAWANLGLAGQQHDFAENYEKYGRGTESFSRAGQDVPLQQLPGLQRFQSTGAGEHSDITVQRLKDATALKTAAMHAKGAGGAAEGSYSAALPTTAETGNMAITARSAKGEPLSHFVTRLTEATPSHKPVSPPADTDKPGQPAATGGGGGQARRNAAAVVSRAAPAGRVANAAPGADPIQRSVQAHLESVVKTENPAAYADIMAKAKMNGGAVQLGRDARGQVVVQGVRGTYQ